MRSLTWLPFDGAVATGRRRRLPPARSGRSIDAGSERFDGSDPTALVEPSRRSRPRRVDRCRFVADPSLVAVGLLRRGRDGSLLLPSVWSACLASLTRLRLLRAAHRGCGRRRPSRRGEPACRRSVDRSSNSHSYSPWNSWNESFENTPAPALSAIDRMKASPRPTAPAGGVTSRCSRTASSKALTSFFGDAVPERGVDHDRHLDIGELLAEGQRPLR